MIRTTFCLAGLLLAGTASAQPATGPRHSVGADLSFSSDADRTDVLRLGLNFDLRYRDEDDHLGVRLERNTYRPAGGTRVRDERVYLRAAGALEGGWTGRAQVGSDGDTLLGSASINDDSAWRKEFFVERDKVETRQGVTRPILYTFVGAALDVPLARTTQATLLGAVQDFTGSNVRSHVRANLIQVLHERIGLSAQLRTRYFHNSRPREFDYFSPEEHVDLLPVLLEPTVQHHFRESYFKVFVSLRTFNSPHAIRIGFSDAAGSYCCDLPRRDLGKSLREPMISTGQQIVIAASDAGCCRPLPSQVRHKP
jgi:hypothetical protein